MHAGRLVTIALLLIGVVAAPHTQPVAAEVGTGPILLGAATRQNTSAMTSFEALAGRRMAANRLFLRWDTAFPNSYSSWLVGRGYTLMVSVKSHTETGAVVRWADVAAAQPGSAIYQNIVRWARGMQGVGKPIWFTYNHEPEASVNLRNGTSTEYIAAWRKVVNVFRAENATNVKFMWIMTDYSFRLPATERRYAPKWWPGDAYVDGIASDAYNWGNCRSDVSSPWRSLAFLIEGQRQFGLLHPDIPLYLTEWATVEDAAQPGRKAQWIRDAQELFKRPDYAQFRGIVYFHYPGKDNCVWFVNSSPTALDAFRSMAGDPYYAGLG